MCLCWISCFKHGLFYSFENDALLLDDDDKPLAELAQCLWNHGCAIPDKMECVATSSEASIVETISEVIHSSATGSNREESDDKLEIQSVTQAEALKALNTIRCFFEHSEDSEEILKLLLISKK